MFFRADRKSKDFSMRRKIENNLWGYLDVCTADEEAILGGRRGNRFTRVWVEGGVEPEDEKTGRASKKWKIEGRGAFRWLRRQTTLNK